MPGARGRAREARGGRCRALGIVPTLIGGEDRPLKKGFLARLFREAKGKRRLRAHSRPRACRDREERAGTGLRARDPHAGGGRHPGGSPGTGGGTVPRLARILVHGLRRGGARAGDPRFVVRRCDTPLRGRRRQRGSPRRSRPSAPGRLTSSGSTERRPRSTGTSDATARETSGSWSGDSPG